MQEGRQYFQAKARGGVHLGTIRNPPYNAVFAEMLEPATQQLADLRRDPETCAIVLTRAGDDFTAGMDLQVAAACTDESRERPPLP